MSLILNALPYRSREYRLRDPLTDAAQYLIRQNQIVCWASLTPENSEEPRGNDLPKFPVTIDTGNGRNFNIREEQLASWAGLTNLVEVFGTNVLVNGQRVSLRKATLWLYRNIPSQLNSDINVAPFPIDFSDGIEVFTDSGAPAFPRLPLLGMRALHVSRLELTINGPDRRVFLRDLSTASAK